MCAINPIHKKRLLLDVYTSQKIPKEVFIRAVIKHSLKMEQLLNESTQLR